MREWLCCISQSQSKSCPLMTLQEASQEASVEEDRWSPVEVLVWIATRSRRFMEALRGLPLSSVEDRLWRLQSENHSPHPMNLSTALLAFREEVQRGSIRRICPTERSKISLLEDNSLEIGTGNSIAPNSEFIKPSREFAASRRELPTTASIQPQLKSNFANF